MWDTFTGERIKRLRSSTGYVHGIAATQRGPQHIATASDDRSVRVYDLRSKDAVSVFEHRYPLTSVSFNESGDQVFAGGIDGGIHAFDLRRKDEALYVMRGHDDTVTGLRLSPDGSMLLSNGMDNTVRMWDVKPFAPAERCLNVFEGAPQGNEQNLIKCAWSPDGQRVAAGSGDRTAVRRKQRGSRGERAGRRTGRRIQIGKANANWVCKVQTDCGFCCKLQTDCGFYCNVQTGLWLELHFSN